MDNIILLLCDSLVDAVLGIWVLPCKHEAPRQSDQ